MELSWDCHGIACIWFNNQNPDDYVSHWYRKTTFLDTYNNLIRPSNGPKGWPIVDATPIAPPYVRRAPGRPKKLRRKANDEPVGSTRKKRNQHTITCTRCKSLGHNKRSCKGKTAADRMIPKGGNKSNCNMNQPGPSATSKGPATTDTKGPAATGLDQVG
ncbi:tyrosine-protein kinase ABL1 [Trifolium repens]|nr:tyrosine-protein kinase ABL1 [Trifolium repens]